MPPMDPATTQYLLQMALAALGALVIALGTLLAFIWNMYSTKLSCMQDAHTALNSEVDELDRRILQLQNSSITQGDVKKLFDERIEPIKDSQNRIENGLLGVNETLSRLLIKLAVIEDREDRERQR